MIKLKVYPDGVMCNDICITRNKNTTRKAQEGIATKALIKNLKDAGIFKAVNEEIDFERKDLD
jgi:hypothetical protein